MNIDSAPSVRVVKRSIVIAGHRTSVSLEDAFWRALKDIASQEGVSLASLVAGVDAKRGAANLSSALRVFVLERAVEIAQINRLQSVSDGAVKSGQSRRPLPSC